MAARIGERQFAPLDSTALDEIVNQIRSGRVTSRDLLEATKKEVAARYRLQRYPSNGEILTHLSSNESHQLKELLRVHPRRSASGIVVVTVFTAPSMCPHGTCVFCPGGPREGTPQSYVLDGPSMKSAIGAKFDAFSQVRNGVRKYSENGHDVTKVEAVIEGGTFIAEPLAYQSRFVKGVYDGLNGKSSGSLEEAQFCNESADSRCVGMTVESKPDWCRPSDVDLMLSYGVTRLEVGVQSLRNEVLKASNRGHSVADSIDSFQVARDSGLKVACHMMPGLPGSNPATDLQDLKRLFEDESFRPDMMKLYPTLVVKGTALARMYSSGMYEPYSLETVVDLLAKMKRFMPSWHRIMRIQREIPEHDIVGGVKNGNLRELVLKRVSQLGYSCNCIRCREVALSDPGILQRDDELQMGRQEYEASGGIEVFCSYEFVKAKKIAGFIRMRNPSPKAHRDEVRGACIVRELKVYGKVVSVGERNQGAWQHKGLGASLLSAMEKEARERFGARRVVVTSAVGTRNYYRRFGYERLGPYMSKRLS